MNIDIKKIVTGSVIALAFVLFLISNKLGIFKPQTENGSIPPTNNPNPIRKLIEDDDDNRPIVVPTPSKTPSPVTVTAYKDGEYTGDIADAIYGNIQVKAIVSGGKLTDVQFLDYPKDRQRSLQISTEATPILKTEAITAQSAQVDIVSGATQTSAAFIESLKSALTKAQA